MNCLREAGCWCTDLPHVIPMPAADAQLAGCLCRTCLLEKIKTAGESSSSGILPIDGSPAPRD
jgi:hypothetical protein